MELTTIEQIIAHNVGVERPVDRLGRVSIPIEFRRALGFDITQDRMVISRVGDYLLLWNSRKKIRCAVCGAEEDLLKSPAQDMHLCRTCLEAFCEA